MRIKQHRNAMILGALLALPIGAIAEEANEESKAAPEVPEIVVVSENAEQRAKLVMAEEKAKAKLKGMIQGDVLADLNHRLASADS